MTNGTTSSSGGGGLVIVLVLVVLIVAGGLGYWFFGRKLICNMKGATSNVATWKPDKFGCIADTCVTTGWTINTDKSDCIAPVVDCTAKGVPVGGTAWSKDSTGTCIPTCTSPNVPSKDNTVCQTVISGYQNIGISTTNTNGFNTYCKDSTDRNIGWEHSFYTSDITSKTLDKCRETCGTMPNCTGIDFLPDDQTITTFNDTKTAGSCFYYTGTESLGFNTGNTPTENKAETCWAKKK